MSERIIPLVMCGGAGTRLWPASREGRPKPFLPLFGQRSTFHATLKRVSDATLFDRPIVSTTYACRFQVLEQHGRLGPEGAIMLEPARHSAVPASSG